MRASRPGALNIAKTTSLGGLGGKGDPSRENGCTDDRVGKDVKYCPWGFGHSQQENDAVCLEGRKY